MVKRAARTSRGRTDHTMLVGATETSDEIGGNDAQDLLTAAGPTTPSELSDLGAPSLRPDTEPTLAACLVNPAGPGCLPLLPPGPTPPGDS